MSSSAIEQEKLRSRKLRSDEPDVATSLAQTDSIEVGKSRVKTAREMDIMWHLTYWVMPLTFTGLALFTRLWKIGHSHIVTWDEAHFGKFASHYLKREFYFDVHPPLGKMLNGLAGFIAGYDGSFEFKSGETYPEGLNFVFMRIWNAIFGAACVPLAYYTALGLELTVPAVWLVTMMVLFDNSYATISRFILLDSMLLFFTFSTMFCLVKFHEYRHAPFTYRWWKWITLMGVSIGCVCSVKWVGMFGTALCGLYTIHDLWDKFGEVKMPKITYVQHWIARVWSLIVVPFFVYAFFFYVHFQVLENSGPGDAQMPSLFQANLRGTDLLSSPLEIAIGSRATIKNMGYGGGLLHSHVQTFPEGSQQQQITCYHHKDSNNDWFFYPNRYEPEYNPEDTSAPIRYLKDRDTVRLIHAQTGRNLHSHAIAAPVTKSDWEVSCYGNLTVGDEKDHWQIEVVDDIRSRDRTRVRTLTSAIRFKHISQDCYLRAANVNLPQWGFKQIEVTCDKNSKPDDQFSHWNIESHWNERLPPADAKDFKSPFWRDFIHLNVAMMTSNNALVPDPDKADELASEAWQWPIAWVGLRMCGWDAHTTKYFLLGNPLVYWGSTLSLVIFGIMAVYHVLRWQRSAKVLSDKQIDQMIYAGLYPAIGWFLHYIPFFIMGRVLYVHHYFPALWFAILVAGYVFDYTVGQFPKNLRLIAFGVAYVALIAVFINFSAFTFGMDGEAGQWHRLQWLKSWRIYSGLPINAPASSSTMLPDIAAVQESLVENADSALEFLSESIDTVAESIGTVVDTIREEL